jgi:prolipoprotein diacylglyceryl transferase
MNTLLQIIWNVDPVAFSFGPVSVRWYGLLYAMGFVLGISLLGKMFKDEGYPEDWADKVLIYTIIATIVGARLGHVFFYDWDYYSQHIGEIFMVWKGGLASHGGVIAIIFSSWLLCKYTFHKSFLWLGDRFMVPAVFVGSMIRLGNLMNSEIYGGPTDMPWGFKFVREYPAGTPLEMIPACHPTQIYEAGSYFLLFILLLCLYYFTDVKKREGFICGTAFAVFFLIRFLLEFIKNDQAAFEADMVLNMGQLLSIPFILLGIGFMVYSFIKPQQKS